VTIEEAVQAAEAGDITAMNALGDIASQGMLLQEAFEWYERSATLGDPYGTLMALISRNLYALVSEGIGDYEGALESWHASLNWIKVIIDDNGNSQEHREIAISKYSHTLSGIGSCLYVLGRNAEATSPLELAIEEGEISAKVVLGLNYYKMMNEQNFEMLIRQAIPLLENVFDPGIALSNSSNLDQRILYMSHRLLEEAYRKGLGGVKPDPTKAYECLLHLETQGLEDYREEVQSALSKYKKGIFGGYKYIG
jgi:Sel1 repeat.